MIPQKNYVKINNIFLPNKHRLFVIWTIIKWFKSNTYFPN